MRVKISNRFGRNSPKSSDLWSEARVPGTSRQIAENLERTQTRITVFDTRQPTLCLPLTNT
ncbi:hypothetical protein DPMN_180802 [Dreissena polymorpha]|uniref:Uncharacterized protein n=1 Tax=Dreissena polymorpha TaxID=45954 RepID=A0A9D4I339_DREPO|nr:hypothetical protein DPMN_180802 [Dreissena polymorpha]